ncbi:ABC transporter ATP-binding protein [Gardnerella vaginalis]|uniref:ABC transporter ATP-binding protein n=2 Tax=Gardnerella vaginalis TaxID=2702 RepID=A0A3E1IRS5_GARVA|nr:ABC transporter ATP-binding protein [Gardnerella vaginalis]RFD75692.1 ABC transporter ATP-binding protein [Gardnerella vaginalis]
MKKPNDSHLEDPLLELKNVSFQYGTNRSENTSSVDDNTYALNRVNLKIYPGEFVGIIGPSGSGKTTLASLFSGAIPHHYSGELLGSVKIAGQDTKNLALTNIACLIGSVIQDIDAQMVAANVEDEILFGLENFGVPHDEIPNRIASSLETVGISDLRNRDLDTLSGGQKQKVAIAAILALKPKVLVLDEPTCALDPVSSRMIFSILQNLNKKFGITIVVIEQKVALLSEYCKRLIVLSKGELVLDAPVSLALKDIDLLRKVGINYPRTTHLIKQLQDEQICNPAELTVGVEETVNTIVKTLRTDYSKLSNLNNSNNAESVLESHEEAFIKANNSDNSNKPCLSINNVSFAYANGVKALKDVSFNANSGELIALIGRNGAGKTTITKIINGLLRPTEGSVAIDGIDTKSLRISQIAKYVSTLFQNPDRQLCKETVLEEVTLSCILIGQNEDEAKAHAMEIIDELELDSKASPFMLSRGQRQMVALAATVVTNPKILLLDEPTCGLDYKECMRIMQVVERLRKNGCCVIMVCHDMEVVLDYATRLITINDGKLIIDGSAHDVFEKPEVCSAAALYPPLLCSVSQGLVAHGFNKCNGLYVRAELVEALRGEKIVKQTVQN